MSSSTARGVVICCVVGLLAAPAAAGKRDRPVRAKKGVSEIMASESASWLAWMQGTKSRPKHYKVWAKKDGGSPFRVYRGRGEAATGGVSGSRLAYQLRKGGRSDLRLYSLSKRSHAKLPAGVNTPAWEFHPSLDGNRLLFARYKGRTDTHQLILFDLKTKTSRVIATTSGKRSIEPGQVNGDYVTWSESRGLQVGEVYRHTISSGNSRRISRGDRLAYGASVRQDGAVFMVRSGPACGKNVTVTKTFKGNTNTILNLPPGVDMWETHVFKAPGSATRVLHERIGCEKGAKSADVYRFKTG